MWAHEKKSVTEVKDFYSIDAIVQYIMSEFVQRHRLYYFQTISVDSSTPQS